jgi:hypothetical protein
MQARAQRALHPRLVARVDPDQTARVAALDQDELEVADRSARHRRPTIRMSRDEIARAVAESGAATTPRTRMARGSGEIAPFDLDLDLEPDPYPDPAFRLLPFRARRPVIATFITAALVAALILALHHIIAGA